MWCVSDAPFPKKDVGEVYFRRVQLDGCLARRSSLCTFTHRGVHPQGPRLPVVAAAPALSVDLEGRRVPGRAPHRAAAV